MNEEFKKSCHYFKIKRGLSVAKRFIIIGFVFFIILLGSNKYTELTVAEKYENNIAKMKIQTDILLFENGYEWNEFDVIEIK